MDRTKLESIATFFAVVSLGALIFLCILASADAIFSWDLFPSFLDKMAVLTIVSLVIILAACFVTSIMLNVSLIAQRVAAISRAAAGEDRKSEGHPRMPRLRSEMGS